MIGAAVGVEGIPHRKRHPEEALSAHQPVAVEAVHPVLVAHSHMRWVPVDLPAPLEHRIAQLLLTTAVAQVPLAAGEDLEGTVALLEELDRMGDGTGLTVELARSAKQFDHPGLRLLHRSAGDLGEGVDRGGSCRLDPLRRLGQDPPVVGDDRPGWEVQLPPPDDVGEVTEGADHGDARALVGIGELMGPDLDLDTEHRRARRRAEQRSVPLVVGMSDQRHAGCEQFGPGGLDVDRVASVEVREGDAMVRPGKFAVLEFGLRHGAAEVDVPQHGRFGLIGLCPPEVAQERQLGDPSAPLVDRRVGAVPVHRESESSEEFLERFLILGGEVGAQLDEVPSTDAHRRLLLLLLGAFRHGNRDREVRVVGERGIAAHPVVVLHPSFGGQTVVVPAHRIEDRFAPHALIAGDRVGVGVTEDMAHVERSAHRRRRGVDRVDAGPIRSAVESVGAVAFPDRVPPRLETFEVGSLGDVPVGSGGGKGRAHGSPTVVPVPIPSHGGGARAG